MQGRNSEDIAKIISRGRDAFRDYSLIEEKLAEINIKFHEAFEKTTPKEDLERRNLWQALQITGMVLEYLLSDIRDGKHAIQQMEQIKRVGKPTLLQRVLP